MFRVILEKNKNYNNNKFFIIFVKLLMQIIRVRADNDIDFLYLLFFSAQFHYTHKRDIFYGKNIVPFKKKKKKCNN